MVAKIAILLYFVATATAVSIKILPLARVAYAAKPVVPAQYAYEYSVNDGHNGDVKQQKESRNGDFVKGSYSFIQPDGTHRIVDYTADKEHGFNAIVRYEGTPKAAYTAASGTPVTKVVYTAPAGKIVYPTPVTEVAYATPEAKVTSAPVTYGPPIVNLAYAAPAIAKLIPTGFTSNPASISFSTPAYSYRH